MSDGQNARTYHKLKKRLFYAGLVLDLVFLSVFQLSNSSIHIRIFASSLASSLWIINGVFFTIFCSVLYAIHLPLVIFQGFVLEHRFGLSNQSFWAWAWDEIKKSVLSFVLILILVEVVYLFLYHFPRVWWVGAGGTWLFFSVALSRIVPNVIIPIFFRYSPLENEQLKQVILDLFRKHHILLEGVYVIDLSSKSKKANAFVCGLGKTRRVVLSDTLTENFTDQEILTVVAHEVGHDKHRDILKLLIVNSVVIFLGFFLVDLCLRRIVSLLGVSGLWDIAALPVFVLAMMVFSLMTGPFLNAFSRYLEREADAFSLRATKSREEFISMMEKLGKMNLAEKEPGRFDEIMFYDHPPISKRIEAARRITLEA